MKSEVSVLCTCYNHQEYIKLALDGILQQVVNFDFELIIYDDFSTDNSRDIIKSVVENYNGNCKIKIIFPEENQYSKGFSPIPFMLPEVEGRYIAICEGDDYWIDNDKLQKQYEILQKDKSVDISFHPSLTLYGDEIKDSGYGYIGDKEQVVDYNRVILKGGGLMPMASIFLRAQPLLDMVSENEDFFKRNFYHSILQTVMTLGKGAIYCPSKMCVYRSMHEGSWSLQQSLDQKKRDREFKAANQRIWKLNKIYNNKYCGLFLKLYYKRNIKFYKDKLKSIYKK